MLTWKSSTALRPLTRAMARAFASVFTAYRPTSKSCRGHSSGNTAFQMSGSSAEGTNDAREFRGSAVKKVCLEKWSLLSAWEDASSPACVRWYRIPQNRETMSVSVPQLLRMFRVMWTQKIETLSPKTSTIAFLFQKCLSHTKSLNRMEGSSHIQGAAQKTPSFCSGQLPARSHGLCAGSLYGTGSSGSEKMSVHDVLMKTKFLSMQDRVRTALDKNNSTTFSMLMFISHDHHLTRLLFLFFPNISLFCHFFLHKILFV